MPQAPIPSTKILDAAKSQAGYNVDLLEGAILHVLQICGCLSAESLDRFALIYAYKRGKRLKPDYASKTLLPRLRLENKIWQVEGYKFYTVSPIVKPNRQMQDAFWVFLEFMEDTDLQTVGTGPSPAQVSFFRQGRSYHIIAVKGDGVIEFQNAVNYEMNMETYQKKGGQFPEQRYIIVFTSMDNLSKSHFHLKSKMMFCTVSYPGGEPIPSLHFVDPSKL